MTRSMQQISFRVQTRPRDLRGLATRPGTERLNPEGTKTSWAGRTVPAAASLLFLVSCAISPCGCWPLGGGGGGASSVQATIVNGTRVVLQNRSAAFLFCSATVDRFSPSFDYEVVWEKTTRSCDECPTQEELLLPWSAKEDPSRPFVLGNKFQMPHGYLLFPEAKRDQEGLYHCRVFRNGVPLHAQTVEVQVQEVEVQVQEVEVQVQEVEVQVQEVEE
ncbi:uncharacterized protein LOC143035508 [Oratosquilla oratoria]|uniref:uncharacterized protein LOC143035508 n=1 Tax=Oratosquilla oratoria TaxID=337810 RepID=UPI003F76C0D1